MPDPRAITVADGVSQVLATDPSGKGWRAALLQVGPAQALVATTLSPPPGTYLDVTLQLKNQPPRRFFASVIGRDERGLWLRWNHLDPGDEKKLLGMLASYARDQQSGGGTRRLIKPKTSAALPVAAGQAGAAPTSENPVSAAPEAGKHTRRLIKPSSRLLAHPAEPSPAAVPPATPAIEPELEPQPLPPAAASSGEESRIAPVVIATTEQYVALPTGGAAAQPEQAPSAAAASTMKDGRLDVGAAIRSRAKTVRAAELAARHDKVRVLNLATIKQLIQDAVAEAVQHLTHSLNEAERKRLLEEAEEGFRERLKAFEREKQSAEERAKALQNELAAARQLLEEERKRTIQAEQFTVSEAGLADLDLRMGKLVERALARGEVNAELECKLREMVAHVLDSEREKLRQKELAAQSEKIALLERKVARLAQSLEETERERDEARKIAEAMEREGLSIQEVRNKYRIGIADDDPQRERKLALMRELAEQNRELRRQLGLAVRSPEEVAAELAAEAQRRHAEAEQRRAELAALRQEAATLAAASAPSTAARDETAGTETKEPASEDTTANEAPLVNPDDLPWEPEAASAPADDTDERGIKVVRSYKRFEPPPLQTPPPPTADSS
ncbi:MAG: hypothetical protein RMM29_01990 [Planctomycetota bacterium]|nr:hypothetical protein [Planctomycetota bacterium]MDW8372408.1 hypothetical protein [Planctomycetota bacterium]